MSKEHLTDSKFWNWSGWRKIKWLAGILILGAVIWTIWCLNTGKKPVPALNENELFFG